MDLQELFTTEFWKRINPELHLLDREYFDWVATPAEFSSEFLNHKQDLLQKEGYLEVSGVDWGVDIDLLARGIQNLDAAGLPPTFCFVYDEYWAFGQRLFGLLEHLIDEPVKFGTIDGYAWLIDGQKVTSGFSIHRDYDQVWNYSADGKHPKVLTMWLALTEVTTANSCISVLPAPADPLFEYFKQTDRDHIKSATDTQRMNEFMGPDVTYPTPADYRALPVEKGTVLLWPANLMHFGGKYYPNLTDQPRMSVSLAVRAESHPMLGFQATSLFHHLQQRLAIISHMMSQYKVYESDEVKKLVEKFSEEVQKRINQSIDA